MDVRKMYEEKKKTPEQMAEYLQPGDKIACSSATGEPPVLVRAIVDYIKKNNIRGCTYSMCHMLPRGLGYEDPEMQGLLTPVSYFFGGSECRGMCREGRADYIPNHLHELGEVITRYHKPRIAVELVSPMDENGYFSRGVSAVEGKEEAEAADIVLLEVTPHMPRVLGDSFIHISEVTAFCETDSELPVVPMQEPSEEDKKIAAFIAERVPDGACIQLGIGKMPDAVGALLQSKRHLGIHSEMFCPSMYELVKAGAVDNSRKQIHRGVSLYAFAAGTPEMYDYLNDNPAVNAYPAAYVNDPYVIAQNDNVVSVNACLEVDIFGQVCSESIGPVQISGSGGQLDYVRGAKMSKGGIGFVAMHSTAKHGTISTIKSILTPGAHVTVPMNDTDNVVTEYGVAELRGKSASERAKALIAIAHPDMRDKLTYEAKKIGLMI
ncbi:MAG: acetyl-CoA hydrolase/transferase family protein [Anaerovoracaceae bacterium]|jgi:4-hydroxybutyrate CoA-transferase